MLQNEDYLFSYIVNVVKPLSKNFLKKTAENQKFWNQFLIQLNKIQMHLIGEQKCLE